MRWSQLKIQMESFFADSVKGRVELRVTRYHNAHDNAGRGWITLDKKQVFSASEYGFDQCWWQETLRRVNASPYAWYSEVYRTPGFIKIHDQVFDDLHTQGILSRGDFTRTLRLYLNTSVERILTNENVLMRALGMLDRRVGKSRLEKMSMDGQPQIVRQLYEFRCQAECIAVKA